MPSAITTLIQFNVNISPPLTKKTHNQYSIQNITRIDAMRISIFVL